MNPFSTGMFLGAGLIQILQVSFSSWARIGFVDAEEVCCSTLSLQQEKGQISHENIFKEEDLPAQAKKSHAAAFCTFRRC